MPDAPSSGKRFSFSQGQHIKLGWEFEKVRQEGRRAVKGCLVLNFRINKDREFSRIGIITSRKVGNAVVRNRARRLIREAFRLHQHDLTSAADLVWIARPSIAGKSFAQVERDYLSLLREAKLLGRSQAQASEERQGTAK